MSIRRFPCTCRHCIAEDFARCRNRDYVGTFTERMMRAKGTRVPAARYHNAERREEDEFVPMEILGDRIFLGDYQYLVR